MINLIICWMLVAIPIIIFGIGYLTKNFVLMFLGGFLEYWFGLGNMVYAGYVLYKLGKEYGIGTKEFWAHATFWLPLAAPIFFLIGWSMCKYAFHGVAMEAMGAKGILPALVRFWYIMSGHGSIMQMIGMWGGFIMLAIFQALMILGSQIMDTLNTFKEKLAYALTVGFGFVASFASAHLAETGFAYMFTIMAFGEAISIKVPAFIFLFTIALVCLAIAIWLIYRK